MTPIPEFTVPLSQTAQSTEVTVNQDNAVDPQVTFHSALLDLKGKGQAIADRKMIGMVSSPDLSPNGESGTEDQGEPTINDVKKREGDAETDGLFAQGKGIQVQGETTELVHFEDTKDRQPSVLDLGVDVPHPDPHQNPSPRISLREAAWDVPGFIPGGKGDNTTGFIPARKGDDATGTTIGLEEEAIAPKFSAVRYPERQPERQEMIFLGSQISRQPVAAEGTVPGQKPAMRDFPTTETAHIDEHKRTLEMPAIDPVGTTSLGSLDPAKLDTSSQELPVSEISEPRRLAPQHSSSEQNKTILPTIAFETASYAGAPDKTAQPTNVRIVQSVDASSDVFSTPPGPFKTHPGIETYFSKRVGSIRADVDARMPAAQAPQFGAAPQVVDPDPSFLKDDDQQKFASLGSAFAAQAHSPNAPHSMHLPSAAPHAAALPTGKLESVSVGFIQSDGQVEVTLKPEELGRISLKLETIGNTTHVIMTAERPDTHELMKRHLDILQTQLREMGYENPKFDFQHSQSARGDTRRPDQEDATAVADARATKTIVINTLQSGLDLKV